MVVWYVGKLSNCFSMVEDPGNRRGRTLPGRPLQGKLPGQLPRIVGVDVRLRLVG